MMVSREITLFFCAERTRKMTSYDGVQLEGLPEWYLSVAREYEACRERVGIMDMTSFSKFELIVS